MGRDRYFQGKTHFLPHARAPVQRWTPPGHHHLECVGDLTPHRRFLTREVPAQCGLSGTVSTAGVFSCLRFKWFTCVIRAHLPRCPGG